MSLCVLISFTGVSYVILVATKGDVEVQQIAGVAIDCSDRPEE